MCNKRIYVLLYFIFMSSESNRDEMCLKKKSCYHHQHRLPSLLPPYTMTYGLDIQQQMDKLRIMAQTDANTKTTNNSHVEYSDLFNIFNSNDSQRLFNHFVGFVHCFWRGGAHAGRIRYLKHTAERHGEKEQSTTTKRSRQPIPIIHNIRGGVPTRKARRLLNSSTRAIILPTRNDFQMYFFLQYGLLLNLD